MSMKFLTVRNTASEGSANLPRSICSSSQSAGSLVRYASKRKPPARAWSRSAAAWARSAALSSRSSSSVISPPIDGGGSPARLNGLGRVATIAHPKVAHRVAVAPGIGVGRRLLRQIGHDRKHILGNNGIDVAQVDDREMPALEIGRAHV